MVMLNYRRVSQKLTTIQADVRKNSNGLAAAGEALQLREVAVVVIPGENDIRICWDDSQKKHNWLVVWNMTFIFPYIGNSHPK